MITVEKLKIYRRYQGDIDMLARIGKKTEKQLLSTADWSLINSWLQDLTLIKSGKASTQFVSNFKDQLTQNCDSAETIRMVEALI